MSSYLLPQILYSNDLHTHIVPIFSEKKDVIINKTLHKYLNSLKGQIDECEMAWDKYKKYTNPYEFIHTIVPNSRQAICLYKPLSRSFFKMIEIVHLTDILHNSNNNANNHLPLPYKTFHLAEGPGGFIEAIAYLRNNPNDIYYGMTLLEEHNTNVPGWRKSKEFLASHPNVIIEKGIDGRGDLMNPRNFLHCLKNYRGQCDLITGDGGFDFSVHYLSQEIVSSSLILCQISFAIAMQKIGGTFIIKMFDTFSKISLDILYLLANAYEVIRVVKPHTSRYANSEKYIVCKNFQLNEKNRQDIVNMLYKMIVLIRDNNILSIKKEYMQTDCCPECEALRYEAIRVESMRRQSEVTTHMESLFKLKLPYYFVNKVEEVNAIFGQQQIENINMTLNLIDNNKYDKLELIKKNNIHKCIQWCKQYGLEYNVAVQQNNIFLASKRTQVGVGVGFGFGNRYTERLNV
jgi:23S rRNA U2552 (ribose-2'-O)-methylase RlmE/FtsJ